MKNKITLGKLTLGLLVIGSILIIVGALLKINHSEHAEMVLMPAIIINFLGIALLIYFVGKKLIA